MSEKRHISNENPFAHAEDANRQNNGEPTSPLAVRIGYGAPESSPPKQGDTTTKQGDTAAKQGDAAAKQGDAAAKPRDAAAKPRDAVTDSASALGPKIDTQAIYDIRKIFAQAQEIQRTLQQTCFEKQADGTFKPKDDNAKVADGSKDGTTVKEYRAFLIMQMSAQYQKAETMADAAMKNPDAVIGATMSSKAQLEAAQQQTKTLQQELKSEGINPSVGAILDSVLVARFLDQHKEVTPAQHDKLTSLRDSLVKQEQLENRYRDLTILQAQPIITRQANSEFLGMIGLPNAAKARMDEAAKVAGELNSPAGRSEFMKRQLELATKNKDDSLDQSLQDKYLKPLKALDALLSSADSKAKAGNINRPKDANAKDDSARSDMDKALSLAKNMPTVDKQDEDKVKSRGEQLQKDREDLNKKLQAGTATPYDVALQHEQELKLSNEATLLNSVKLAKQKVGLDYAGFLLNVDGDKNFESNRKYARDILLSMKFDNLGKIVASLNGEQFDKLLAKALNGTEATNEGAMKAFSSSMQEHDALLKKAAGVNEDGTPAKVQPTEEETVKYYQAAREKADDAARVASRINRDGADGNQKAILKELDKQIATELAKPEGQRDQFKISLMRTIQKPTHELNAEEKQQVAGLLECMKPKEQANKAIVDSFAGKLKDGAALFDIVSSYSLIQQMEMQKQAVNQARLAILNIDVAFDRGENNSVVADIEHDRYGKGIIDALNSVPGHDGRTQWGDIKEATRDLAWYETAWKWTKGTLKEVAISLASWGVGALAGLGAAALFSWSGPGAIIGGGAVGFAAGAATGSAIRYAIGDKVTLLGATLDGVSGLTGGVMGTGFAVSRGIGTAALRNVVMQQAERGVTIGANQTWTAFKAAGGADKLGIAIGGNRTLASFAAANLGSLAYEIPTGALTGNYKNFGDYARGTGYKLLIDVPGNLFSSWIGARVGGSRELNSIANGASLYKAAAGQLRPNLLWSSPEGRHLFGGTPHITRSQFNAPVYDFLQPKPAEYPDQGNK